jgi:hypothetical protein
MGPVESTRTRGETMATVEVGEQQLLIGESWRGASSGATYEKTNPYTGGSAGRAAAAMREMPVPRWTPPPRRSRPLSEDAAIPLD